MVFSGGFFLLRNRKKEKWGASRSKNSQCFEGCSLPMIGPFYHFIFRNRRPLGGCLQLNVTGGIHMSLTSDGPPTIFLFRREMDGPLARPWGKGTSQCFFLGKRVALERTTQKRNKMVGSMKKKKEGKV